MEGKEYLVHVSVKTGYASFDCAMLKNIMSMFGYCANVNAGDNGTWTDGNIDTKAKQITTLIHYEGYARVASTKRAHQDIVDVIRKAHENGVAMLFDIPQVTTEWTETEPQHTHTT